MMTAAEGRACRLMVDTLFLIAQASDTPDGVKQIASRALYEAHALLLSDENLKEIQNHDTATTH